MLRKRIAVERFRELCREALPLAEAAGYVSHVRFPVAKLTL
jgi:hypothetical protein